MIGLSFKTWFENLWGAIPVGGRKPSDGQPFANNMTDSKGANSGGGIGGGIGGGPGMMPPNAAALKMMKKKMKKQ